MDQIALVYNKKQFVNQLFNAFNDPIHTQQHMKNVFLLNMGNFNALLGYNIGMLLKTFKL